MSLRSTLALCLVAASSASAQQKFTTQIMVVPAFQAPDRGMGGRASGVVRDRLSDAFPRSELRVVSGGDLDDWLRLSGFEENVALTDGELKELAKKFRADERITGTVARVDQRIRIDAVLALVRDPRLAQPLEGEGASVTDAADAVAKQAIAARRQLVPLRLCENLERANKPAEAAAAAAAGIAAYPRAVPSRLCLLNALAKAEAAPDTIISVALATLDVAPGNAIALGNLAEAYDEQGKFTASAPVWLRLLATDSTNDDLVERVVNALARGHNTVLAQPVIDRATTDHADNLPLLKLRWLVHLANADWKGAIDAGEKLLAADPATQADPDFRARLSNAYRSDHQPVRALAVAAVGAATFPADAPLYIAYLQLLKMESDSALPRGLAAFPQNAELHVVAAQSLKASGNAVGALRETRRALTENPRLPHGYLQLAQLAIDAGEVDSAYAAIAESMKFGEDTSTVAQFALARGNALFQAANTSKKRDDFQRALRFLTLANRLRPTPEAKFLLGASALSVSQSASTEAPATKSCELSRLADSTLTDAEINLVGGGSVAPDAAKQYLDFASKLRPYVDDQVKTFCGSAR